MTNESSLLRGISVKLKFHFRTDFFLLAYLCCKLKIKKICIKCVKLIYFCIYLILSTWYSFYSTGLLYALRIPWKIRLVDYYLLRWTRDITPPDFNISSIRQSNHLLIQVKCLHIFFFKTQSSWYLQSTPWISINFIILSKQEPWYYLLPFVSIYQQLPITNIFQDTEIIARVMIINQRLWYAKWLQIWFTDTSPTF